MFQCQICRRYASPGMRATRLVVERRNLNYPARKSAHEVTDPNKRPKRSKKDDPGGMGWEVAREIVVCSAYASGPAMS